MPARATLNPGDSTRQNHCAAVTRGFGLVQRYDGPAPKGLKGGRLRFGKHDGAPQLPRQSPTYTQTGCCRPGHRALPSLGRTVRTNKTSQDFVIFAANAIRASDDANCRCRAGVTLRARRSGRAGRSSGALRSGRSAFTSGSNWTLATGLSLGTLWSDRPRRSRRPSRPALADGALGADRSLLALRALGTGRPNGTRRASFASWTWRTLRSWRRSARRERDDRDGSRNSHQLSHQPLPVRGRRDDARAAARKLTKRRTTVLQVRLAGLPQSTST
jgi:hypothetical protein